MNVASRNGLKLQYSTLAVMDISEAAVSAMQRPCFDGVRNFALLVRRFRTYFVFGQVVVREGCINPLFPFGVSFCCAWPTEHPVHLLEKNSPKWESVKHKRWACQSKVPGTMSPLTVPR